MIKINRKKILIFIILVFVVLNISWFSITSIKYNKFVKDLPKFGPGLSYSTLKDGYNYNVKKPNYLSYTGNLGVSNSEKGEFLIIWPLIFGGYKYNISIQRDGIVYSFYVDENMNPLDKDDTNSASNIEKHKADIDALLSKANEMWPLK
ncbi:MAG TPA: hypothetical protein DCM59_03915 [Clostridium sp.]|nr:hypothetical protein [Clostridium sp.]